MFILTACQFLSLLFADPKSIGLASLFKEETIWIFD
jgi:hypothetical protein